ncbi:hypothetical protein Taro_019134, partial [Colocasia esculenta]|nr:hypothetical protein [Colocasia esculenta]
EEDMVITIIKIIIDAAPKTIADELATHQLPHMIGDFLEETLMMFLLLSIILAISFALEPSIARHVDHRGVEFRRSKEEVRWLFEDWLVRHDKSYNETTEKEHRFEVFKENLRFIKEHNHPQRNHSYTVDLNYFADLTAREFKSIYLNTRPDINSHLIPPPSDEYMVLEGEKLPRSVDWRVRRAVSPVKHQGHCGSCWAFSTVATIEGLNQIITGRMITLSEQQLLDCNNKNWGCNGGWPDIAFAYVKKYGGLDTRARYPYRESKGTCRKNTVNVVSIDGYNFVPRYNESALQKAVSRQPISVIIRSCSRGFQFYKSGIYNGPCGMDLDHAVTLVGYDTDLNNGKDYWIVKNSWGQGWGEEGYAKIERNVRSYDGKCGITAYPTYPVKKGYTFSQ